ncbi:MAG: carbohydrate kinase family protein [Gaiellaceae bacterium]
MLVCTLGDLLLDVIVRLETRLAPGDDAVAATSLAPGGQAANVAAWATELGASARIVAVQADDDAGTIVRRELASRGVDVRGPRGERTGVVVSLVQPDGDRTMASDRGSAPDLPAEAVEGAWLACDALHLSGYSLLGGAIAEAAPRAAALAHEHGARVSVDLSSWTHVRRLGARMREALAQVKPDVVFGNEREWEAIGPVDTPTRVVKRGPRGIVVDGDEHGAVPATAVDSTGAGDALAAGFIVGGTNLALETAARCVAQIGAMPPLKR